VLDDITELRTFVNIVEPEARQDRTSSLWTIGQSGCGAPVCHARGEGLNSPPGSTTRGGSS
jgi:hypothetical protein